MMQFAELNLHHRGNAEKTTNLVRRAVRMGYDAVVINIDIGQMEAKSSDKSAETEHQPPRKKKRKSNANPTEAIKEQSDVIGGGGGDVVPDPFLVNEKQLDLSSLEQAGRKFRQFSRLTVHLTDSTSVHKLLHHAKLKLYDLVAVRFDDEQILMTLQRKGHLIDLISIEADSGKVPWLYLPKVVQACVACGLGFELVYSKALFSQENRRQFFSNARSLMTITRGGRGVVLSSGADEIIAIRAPYDAANLCTLFGMEPRHGRKFVAANAKAILLRSQSRRTIKGSIHVTSDLSAIPSSLGQPSELTLQKLAQIPEFENQLKLQEKDIDRDVEMIAIV
uniref:Ribonuclease P protein subunit p30 n=1 Tax=Ditylenchus dipsaci TaxID=166011 RepID=A0A915E2C7_9BILA